MPLSLHLLPERGDVDTSDDLIRHYSTSLLKWLEPRISVIIPTLNEALRLARPWPVSDSVELRASSHDGGGEDVTVKVARQAGVRVIHSKPGRAYQMNEGARVTLEEMLLFLHADTALPGTFMRDVEIKLAQPHTATGTFHLSSDMSHTQFSVW